MISARTVVAGVEGQPIAHSLSPILHNAWLEAAGIDGAGRWKQTIHISLPALVPLMVVLTILAIQQIIRGDFGLFYQIPRNVGSLYPATDVIDTYVFRGLMTGDMAITAAVGLFQSVVAFLLIVGTNLAVRRISPEHSLF